MLTGEQIRAARALLRWEQKDLAEAAQVSDQTIKRLEKMRGQVSGQLGTVQRIKNAMEKAGVKFINAGDNGAGVRLRKER